MVRVADRHRSRAELAAWLACVLGLAWPTALAADAIGKVIKVRPVVTALEGTAPPRELKLLDPVENGLRVVLSGRDSLLLVALYGSGTTPVGEGRHRIYASLALHGPSDIRLRESPVPPEEGGFKALLDAAYGKLRLSLSPGNEAEVTTPDGTAGVKGTLTRLLVDRAVGTFIAVDEGTVVVQAAAGGEPVLVTAGHWVLVPPGGLPTRPAPLGAEGEILEDPVLLGCCTGVEPPKPPERR